MEDTPKNNRIWEIDYFRGIAIILMVVFHIIFDMRDIYNYPVNYESGIFYYVGKIAAILFMLIAGISCFFSRGNLKRGAKVFTIGMLITAVTYIFMRDLTIKFGILHFLGISMMLYPIFKGMNRYLILIFGTVIIIAGYYMSKIVMPFDYLFPLGLISSNFTSGDYYPLFPWFGVFLYGIFLGMSLYKEKKSIFKFQMKENPIMFIGRHSLFIYVVHQPLIMLILNIIMKR
jgi:Predicted membrane protein